MRGRRKKIMSVVIKGIVLAAFLVFFLAPVYTLVIESLKPESQWLTGTLFPTRLTLSNYGAVLHGRIYRQVTYIPPIMGYMINSLIVSLAEMVISILLGSLAAYAIQRYRTGGSFLSGWIISMMFIPPVGVIIPLLIYYTRLGLYDTLTVLIISGLIFTLPLAVWIMIAVYQGIPTSLEEAAYVDGFGRLRTIFRFIYPVALYGFLAVGILVFVFSWNSFTIPLVLTSSTSAQTLSVYISEFQTLYGSVYGPEAAAGVLMSIPTVIFVGFIVKYLGKGLVSGFGKR
jgi:multiple sugar transport system permease protein